MHALEGALAKYYNDNNLYPATPFGGRCGETYNNAVNLSSALVPKYIAAIPKDPKPRACEYNYLYRATPDRKSYILLVNMDNIDPATYSDHWCIGSFSGSVPPLFSYYRLCPS
jgi:hypothetical protein